MTDLFEKWPAREPPAGFAERVIAARRGRRIAVRIGVAVVAACVLVGFFGWPRGTSGAAAPLQRASVALGRRGVAVAEAGAALRWQVDARGAARVAQERGDVFYRIDRGGPFQVSAAGGEIFVTGTCFRVEGVPMTSFAKMTLSAAGGAAAPSAGLRTVDEGRGRIPSPRASSEVSAGEQARSEPGTPPRIVAQQGATPPALLAPPAETAPSATREDLLQRTQEERARIAALQSRVRELEKERARLLASQRPGEAETSGTPGRPPGSKFQDFTQPDLLAMAHTRELRMDIPPIDRETWQMPPDLGARLHLSEDEQVKAAAADK